MGCVLDFDCHELPEGKIILTCAGWENLLVPTNFPTKDTSKLFFKLKLIQLSLVFSAHLFLSAVSLLTWRAQTDCMCSRDYIKLSNRTTQTFGNNYNKKTTEIKSSLLRGSVMNKYSNNIYFLS